MRDMAALSGRWRWPTTSVCPSRFSTSVRLRAPAHKRQAPRHGRPASAAKLCVAPPFVDTTLWRTSVLPCRSASDWYNLAVGLFSRSDINRPSPAKNCRVRETAGTRDSDSVIAAQRRRSPCCTVANECDSRCPVHAYLQRTAPCTRTLKTAQLAHRVLKII